MNRGKDFEGVFSECVKRVDSVQITRLYDPQGGYAGVAHHCDFIIYLYPKEYHIECKSHKGASMPIYSNDPKKKYGCISNKQWEGLLERSHIPGVVCGVVLWLIDKDLTVFIPIQTLERLRNEGKKSFGIKHIDETCVILRGTKKRVFFDYNMQDFFNNFLI